MIGAVLIGLWEGSVPFSCFDRTWERSVLRKMLVAIVIGTVLIGLGKDQCCSHMMRLKVEEKCWLPFVAELVKREHQHKVSDEVLVDCSAAFELKECLLNLLPWMHVASKEAGILG